jgi:hypothetical protein
VATAPALAERRQPLTARRGRHRRPFADVQEGGPSFPTKTVSADSQ